MAFNLFGRIFVSAEERKCFTEPELKFIRFHERSHNVGWWRFPVFTMKQRWRSERHAQKLAIERMLEEGYDMDQLLRYEIEYRLWEKYGLRLDEYIEYMHGGLKNDTVL